MTVDLIWIAALTIGPALVALGFLAMVAMIVVGLAAADTAEGRLVRRPSADPQP